MQVITYLDTIDKQLFLFLNGLHCPLMDIIMWQISQKLIWIPLYSIIIWYLIRERKWNTLATLLFIGLMIVMSDQLSGIIKNSVHRLRPSHNPEFTGIIHNIRNYFGGSYGFVSSHAANSFAVATFIFLFFKKKWVGIFIFVWAFLVSYSRIYLGVHYPFDVLGGALVGIFSGIFIFYVEKYFYWRILIKGKKEIEN